MVLLPPIPLDLWNDWQQKLFGDHTRQTEDRQKFLESATKIEEAAPSQDLWSGLATPPAPEPPAAEPFLQIAPEPEQPFTPEVEEAPQTFAPQSFLPSFEEMASKFKLDFSNGDTTNDSTSPPGDTTFAADPGAEVTPDPTALYNPPQQEPGAGAFAPAPEAAPTPEASTANASSPFDGLGQAIGGARDAVGNALGGAKDLAGQALGKVGETYDYLDKGPLAGPVVGLLRQRVGQDQLLDELASPEIVNEWNAARVPYESALQSGATPSPEVMERYDRIKKIRDQLLTGFSSDDVNAAYDRSPGKDAAEVLGRVGQAGLAMSAAGTIRTASTAENALAASVDPLGQATGGVLEHMLPLAGRGIGQVLGRGREAAPASRIIEQAPDAATDLAPTFYSQAEQTLQAKMPNRASGAQIGALLRNNGVKPEELKWSGLDDLLAYHHDKPLTKDEVLSFLQDNNVRVDEVLKDNQPSPLQ